MLTLTYTSLSSVSVLPQFLDVNHSYNNQVWLTSDGWCGWRVSVGTPRLKYSIRHCRSLRSTATAYFKPRRQRFDTHMVWKLSKRNNNICLIRAITASATSANGQLQRSVTGHLFWHTSIAYMLTDCWWNDCVATLPQATPQNAMHLQFQVIVIS